MAQPPNSPLLAASPATPTLVSFEMKTAGGGLDELASMPTRAMLAIHEARRELINAAEKPAKTVNPMAFALAGVLGEARSSTALDDTPMGGLRKAWDALSAAVESAPKSDRKEAGDRREAAAQEALRIAIALKKQDAVEFLSSKADLRKGHGKDDSTALIFSASMHPVEMRRNAFDEEVFKILLARSDAKKTNKKGESALIAAARATNVAALAALLPLSDAGAQDGEGQDALMKAAKAGGARARTAIELLLPASDLSLRDTSGRSALALSGEAMLGEPAGKPSALGLLIESQGLNAKGRPTSQLGRALIAAAQTGNTPALREFLPWLKEPEMQSALAEAVMAAASGAGGKRSLPILMPVAQHLRAPRRDAGKNGQWGPERLADAALRLAENAGFGRDNMDELAMWATPEIAARVFKAVSANPETRARFMPRWAAKAQALEIQAAFEDGRASASVGPQAKRKNPRL